MTDPETALAPRCDFCRDRPHRCPDCGPLNGEPCTWVDWEGNNAPAIYWQVCSAEGCERIRISVDGKRTWSIAQGCRMPEWAG